MVGSVKGVPMERHILSNGMAEGRPAFIKYLGQLVSHLGRVSRG